jgi:AcrR family transcriptional regulator
MVEGDREGGGRRKKASVRRGLVQHEIFEQAAHLFAQRGYAGTSFQDIADAVGLTRPALYHYVKSKDDLLAGLVDEITVVAAVEVAQIAQRATASATERLREIVVLLVQRQGDRGELFRLLLRSEADLPEPVAVAYATNRRAVLRSVTDVVAQGVQRGEFRPVTPSVAALGTLGIVNWVAWWYHPGSSHDLVAISAELAEQAIQGLALVQDGPVSSTPPAEPP